MTPAGVVDAIRHMRLRSAANFLGRWCLAHEGEIRVQCARSQAESQVEGFFLDMSEVPDAAWDGVVQESHSVQAVLDGMDHRLARVVEEPLRPLAVLRALAGIGLARWFRLTDDLVRLKDGDPVPLLVRDLSDASGALTPLPRTVRNEELLCSVDFTIYRESPGSPIAVELDYRRRILVDEATAPVGGREPGLAKMASLHPYASFVDDVRYTDLGDTWFDVGPKSFDRDAIIRNLAAANEDGAQIAVLCELCLPDPDALGPAIRSDPERFPSIVVAGSAHVTTPEGTRRNVARVYGDGVVLLDQAKFQGLLLHKRLSKDADAPRVKWPEGITPELPHVVRLPSGSVTRMAVGVCADLVGERLSDCFRQLCVNLLIVPAMTPKLGNFTSTASAIAGSSQGFTLVVNTVAPPPPLDEPSVDEPFLLVLGRPFAQGSYQAKEWFPESGEWRIRSLIDPANAAEPVTWKAWV